MSIFKSFKTQEAFENWLSIGGGINPNPPDVQRFFVFVKVFCQNEERVTKEQFVNEVKKYTHTSIRINRGVCQKYYSYLDIIQKYTQFLK